MERDFFMSAEEAKTYGIIDHVITKKEEVAAAATLTATK
jgi:ATP-dependent protease ClpP protease subunit